MGWVVEWRKVPYRWRSLDKVRADAIVYSTFAFARGRSFSKTVDLDGVGFGSDVEARDRRTIARAMKGESPMSA